MHGEFTTDIFMDEIPEPYDTTLEIHLTIGEIRERLRFYYAEKFPGTYADRRQADLVRTIAWLTQLLKALEASDNEGFELIG